MLPVCVVLDCVRFLDVRQRHCQYVITGPDRDTNFYAHGSEWLIVKTVWTMLVFGCVGSLDMILHRHRHRRYWDTRVCNCRLRQRVAVYGYTFLALVTLCVLMMIDRERVIPNILANNIRPQPPAPRAKNTSKENIYMCGKILGRVGNAFFNYASIVGIARANNMTLYLKDESVLADVLQNPPTATSAREFDEKCSTALFLPQPKCCAFYPQFMQLPKDDHYMVITCLISWRYFENIKAEIKSLLQFRTDVQTEAQRIVGKVRSQTKNVTVVGMHIRRGDQSGWIAYLHGHNPVTPEYVSRAMTYFLQRFPHVHFMVASEDTAWCQQYVGQGSENVTIMEGNSAAVDIAVLTLTDHMIVSIGTFGWWAGYLNPGIKTYMKGFIGADSDFSGNFDDLNATDYVYPDWIPL